MKMDTGEKLVGLQLNSDQVKLLKRLNEEIFGSCIQVDTFVGLLVKLACTHPKTVVQFFVNFHKYIADEGIDDGDAKMDVLDSRIKLANEGYGNPGDDFGRRWTPGSDLN